MNALCVIPARGGSKRIPRKNIRPFLEKPIITYSIDAALQSGLFSSVMVSTDDDEIAEISRSAGADVPFIRSAENADDHAGIADVVLEVIDGYKKQGSVFDLIGCILPTAPLLLPKDITIAYKVMRERKASGIYSLARFSYPIQRAQMIGDDGFVHMVWPEHMFTRSQDLPARYHDAGQFYLVEISDFLEHKTFFVPRATGFELPETRVQDIDTEEDWLVAEMKYRMARQ